MPSIGVAMYLNEKDYLIYVKHKLELNKTTREAFDKKMDNLS